MPKPLAILLLCIGLAGAWMGFRRSLDLTPLQRDFLIAGGLGAGIAGIGGSAGWIARRRKTMMAIATDEPDWSELLPAKRLRERYRQAVIAHLTVWPAAVLGIDLLRHAQSIPTGGWIFVTVAAALLGATGFSVIRLFLSSRRLGDVRLLVRPIPPRRGENLDVRIMQSPGPTQARLVCMERAIFHQGRMTQLVVRIHGQQPFALTDGSGQAIVEKSWPPTGRKGVTMYPYYTWEVRVESAGMERYGSAFPVTVER